MNPTNPGSHTVNVFSLNTPHTESTPVQVRNNRKARTVNRNEKRETTKDKRDAKKHKPQTTKS